MQRLGGQCIRVSPETSSIAKGESIADTVRCLQSYADAIVMRHPRPGSVQEGARFASIPVCNVMEREQRARDRDGERDSVCE